MNRLRIVLCILCFPFPLLVIGVFLFFLLDEPGFYCDNHLMLGKTHLKLGHKEEARQWLEKTIECKAKRPEDEKVEINVHV